MGNTFYSVSATGIYCTNYSYPFGSLLPGRSLNPTNYRYSYQNQEKDNETGYHNFQLRQYTSLLGRWMTPDPYGQHHSPYLAMSNNPISAIDPDGGRDCYIDGMMVPCSAADNYMNNNTAGTDFDVDFAGFAVGTGIGHAYGGQAYYGSKSYGRAAGARDVAWNNWKETNNVASYNGNYSQFHYNAENSNYDNQRGQGTVVDITDFVDNYLSGFGNDTWGNGVFDFFLQDGNFDLKSLEYISAKSGLPATIIALAEARGMQDIASRYKNGESLLNLLKDHRATRNFGNIGRGLGVAGLLISSVSLGNKVVNKPSEVKNSDLIRFGVSAALTFAAVSNPVGIVGIGLYGLVDYYYGDKIWNAIDNKTGINNNSVINTIIK